MMLRTKDGKTTAIDFREMAPEQATRICSLTIRATRTAKNRSLHLASGTPGGGLLISAGKIRHHAAEQGDPSGD
jgi:gamma-glutamyltranspeptidase